MLTSLSMLIGFVLILMALRDIGQELFKPSASGRLSRAVSRVIWRLFRRSARRRPDALLLSGPVILLSILLTWVALLVCGWALVLWPWLPQEFMVVDQLSREDSSGIWTALYLSIVTLTTLGYGDIAPEGGWLRLFLPLEALVGFALLTASITWMLSIYPVLDRRRALAQRIAVLQQSEQAAGEIGRSPGDAQTLEGLAEAVMVVEGDLERFPVTWYFHEPVAREALPVMIPTLLRWATRSLDASEPRLRRQAAVTKAAVDGLASSLTERGFIPHGSTQEILAAWAAEHCHDPSGEVDG